jgi:hypothetical protein
MYASSGLVTSQRQTPTTLMTDPSPRTGATQTYCNGSTRDYYADVSRHDGRAAINDLHAARSEMANDEGHDAFRWTATRHDTEVDAFAQGSQPYRTSPNIDWYNYSSWYNDPPRYDGCFTSNESNHLPTETWHAANPMNVVVHDTIVQGTQPLLPHHYRGTEGIRELFRIFRFEITEIELCWLSSDDCPDPTRLVHLGTKPAIEIYNKMMSSFLIQRGYRHYGQPYIEQRFLEFYVALKQIGWHLIEMACDRRYDDSINVCIDFIFVNHVPAIKLDYYCELANKFLARDLDDIPRLLNFVQWRNEHRWRNGQYTFDNTLYHAWALSTIDRCESVLQPHVITLPNHMWKTDFADNVLAPHDTSSTKNTSTKSTPLVPKPYVVRKKATTKHISKVKHPRSVYWSMNAKYRSAPDNEPRETNPCNDLTYGNDPTGMIATDAVPDLPAPPAYTDSQWQTDSTSVHPQSSDVMVDRNKSSSLSRAILPVIDKITNWSASAVRRLRSEGLSDQPTDRTRCISDPDSMSTQIQRTSLRSRLRAFRTSWFTIPPADSEHTTSDIGNIPPMSTDLERCQDPGTIDCSSNHPDSHEAEYLPPPYDEGDDNPIDRGGQSPYILSVSKTPCTRTAVGIVTDCTSTRSQEVYHQAARMLPYFPWDDDPRDTYHPSARVLSHFPWDDDPGPSESSTKHQRDMYHPAARVLPHFPWDDDPGTSASTPKHQRDMYHPAARMLSYFPSDDDPDPTNICTIQ